jgi:hypothetical protein
MNRVLAISALVVSLALAIYGFRAVGDAGKGRPKWPAALSTARGL